MFSDKLQFFYNNTTKLHCPSKVKLEQKKTKKFWQNCLCTHASKENKVKHTCCIPQTNLNKRQVLHNNNLNCRSFEAILRLWRPLRRQTVMIVIIVGYRRMRTEQIQKSTYNKGANIIRVRGLSNGPTHLVLISIMEIQNMLDVNKIRMSLTSSTFDLLDIKN